MNAYVDIGGSEILKSKGALLVYEGRSRSFVTWHDIRFDAKESAPYLGEAQEVTIDFIQHLAQGLGTVLSTEIFPESILARTAEVIVWWTPAMVRTMFFAAHDPKARQLSGKRFAQPPLVWKVNSRELFIRALPANSRPNAATPLQVAPYWNVDGETGCVCQGSMRSPDDASIGSISIWERAFFRSEFTHHTGTKRLTSHPRGFLRLWSNLSGGGSQFPMKYLTRANETLEQFVLRR